MLQSTANLLFQVHHFFDEIDYRPSSKNFDVDEMVKKTIDTMNHAQGINDALCLAKQFAYYLKHEEKFLKKYYKYPEFWDDIEYHGREEIAVVDDEEAIGNYYITNLYANDYKQVFISSVPYGSDLYGLEEEDGYFSFGDKSEYYLRYSKLSSTKMVLTDKNKQNIATVVLNKDCGIFLNNNKTRYELVLYDVGIAFFEKEYYDSLDGEDPDLDKECKGFIQWDILDKNANYGLSRLEVYDDKADFDLMMILAASCFLVFRSYIKSSYSYAGMHAVFASGMLFRRR